MRALWLYRNEADGTFTEVTEEAGFLPAPGKNLGATELDFNRDGWPDLAVANDMQRDLLYRNDGDGTFTELGMISGMAFDEKGRARAGMGIDAGDGRATIFIGNFSNEMIGVYRYEGHETFVDRAATSQIGYPSRLTLTFGLFLFDVDLDGDLDLFAANGHMQEDIEEVQDGITYRQAPQLFLHTRDGVFEEATASPGSALRMEIVARGAAHADYDRDGDVDILVTENGGPAHLWRNDTPAGNFLRVELEGRASARDGIGARVVAVVGDWRIERRIRTGSSYLSQSEKAAHFGLADATRVDSLLIIWPSGWIDRLAGIEANREIHVVEGEGVDWISPRSIP